MPQCCAPKCKNRGAHTFPKEPNRRKEWELALRIKDFKASPSARLCAAHFKEEDYYGQSIYTDYKPLAKFLKKTAVPSIFFFTKTKKPAALERQQRFKERSHKKEFNVKLKPSTVAKELQHESPSTSQPSWDLSLEIKCELEERLEDVNASVNVAPSSKVVMVTQGTQVADIFKSKTVMVTKGTQVNNVFMYGSIYRYEDDNEGIRFYTGFESYRQFQEVYSTLSPMAHKIIYYGSKVMNLSTENQFFMIMMKLRQNKCNYELGKFFNVSETTVANIFITWINFIYQLWRKIDIFPSKEIAQYCMPESFQKFDPKNILDGICNELMTKCQSGDSVPLDAEFTFPYNRFGEKDLTVKIPPFLKGKSQIENKQVHIKRIIGLTKNYKILKSDLNRSYIPIVSKIFFICFMCCNLRECIQVS